MAFIRPRKRSDGSTAFVVNWRDADTGKQTTKTFDDKGEADLLLRFLDANDQSFTLAKRAAKVLRSKAPTVTAAVEHHIDLITGVESGTLKRYRQLCRNHIETSPIGPVPLDQLERRAVLDWFNNLPVASKTKKNIHSLLSAALTLAVNERLVPENVAKGIRAPKTKVLAHEPVFMDRAEVEAIAEAMPYPKYRLMVRTIAGSGLRFGEVTALRVKDVRIRDGRPVLNVTRAWKLGENGYEIGGPKTIRGKRTVALSKSFAVPLSELMAGRKPTDLLFTTREGGRVRNNNFHDYHWDPIVKQLAADGVLHDEPWIHDLRHTHASMLIAEGVDLVTIQRRLGHESIKTTVDTYGHLQSGADELAADKLDAAAPTPPDRHLRAV